MSENYEGPERRQNKENESYRYISSVLGTILITGLIAWFSFGQGVTRVQAIEIVKHYAPYVQDRKFIIETVGSNAKNISQLETKVDKLIDILLRVHGNGPS